MFKFYNSKFNNAIMVANKNDKPKILLMKDKEQIYVIEEPKTWATVIKNFYPELDIRIDINEEEEFKIQYKGMVFKRKNEIKIFEISKQNLDKLFCDIDRFVFDADNYNSKIITKFNEE